MDKLREKNVNITMITEDLGIVTPETKLQYKLPVGESRGNLPPVRKDPGKVKLLRRRILKLVRKRIYEKIFVALNKHYQELLPDLTLYAKKIITNSRGLAQEQKHRKNGYPGEDDGH